MIVDSPQPWAKHAACHGLTHLFYPERGESGDAARLVCAVCVVREACLSYALKRYEKYGIWGGMNETERKAEARRRRRRVA